MEWSIASQMAWINLGMLEEQEVSLRIQEVEGIVMALERIALSPPSTRLTELEPDNFEGSSS